MVTVAIVAILASIALPSYADYVLRGRLVDATNALTAMRARMEQYYQDNRSYAGGPCAASTQWAGASAAFTFSCTALTASTYSLVASGTGAATGFSYKINEAGTMSSQVSPAWGGAKYTNCWAMKRSGCS